MVLVAVTLLCFLRTSRAANVNETRWITYQAPDGSTIYLDDDRQPAIFTGNFGDCLGNSLINVTRFDAAYYKDNMTILFHLAGTSGLTNESLMMYIGVYAYGEARFDLTFDPCGANIDSLCPVNRSVPIEATAIIPVGISDVSTIPPIALSIPDFEGEAILRLFANSTESEIGCYSAVLKNGNSFSQPNSVGSILGIFTFVAMLASFATAAYGEAVPTMRLHYAHSLSVGVVFAVFQHIFFTGALSVNWPSVLVAWWSNFAWAGGMINSSAMQSSINHLIGNNVGNTSQVGAAASGSTQESLGGGYDISQIYKRAFTSGMKRATNHPLMRDIASEIYNGPHTSTMKRDVLQRSAERMLQSRDLANASTRYRWYGHPVGSGLPLPGNYSGFAGTLAQEDIQASNAFMTGFLWLLILLALLVGSVVIFKFVLEGLARIKMVKQDRFIFFRSHWLGYSASVALRTCYLAFFMIMFLTIFQFTYQSSGGVKAIAAIVFVVFLFGMGGAVTYAILCKQKLDRNDGRSSRTQGERKKLLGKIPWFGHTKIASSVEEVALDVQMRAESKSSSGPFWKRQSDLAGGQNGVQSIHDNEEYTKKFGWLAARFRRTRWWFFAACLVYEFLRAIFYAGASGYALAQVFGLLIIEFFAFILTIWAKPFEGQRLNILVVYCLGFSKVACVALSAAFYVDFNIQRIITTVIGIIIIIIQGVLTIVTLIAIVVGAISSYLSISRNQEDFSPKSWVGMREKYFDHLDRAVNDVPRLPKPKKQKKKKNALPADVEEPTAPNFEMKSVRRLAKIEDEDVDFASEMRMDPAASRPSLDDPAQQMPIRPVSAIEGPTQAGSVSGRRSRAASVQSTNQGPLPYGARAHRPSWSTRDFSQFQQEQQDLVEVTPVDMTRAVAEDEPIVAPQPVAKKRHSWTPSRSGTIQNPKVRPQTSSDALQVGGDVSSRDVIGSVPVPTSRPRAGTHGSSRGSGTWEYASNTEVFTDAPETPIFPQRGASSRMPILTPAQEQEEWLMPTSSREH